MRALFFLIVSGTVHFLAAQWILSVFPAARARRKVVLAIAAALSLMLPAMRGLGWWIRTAWFHDSASLAFIELSLVGLALMPIATLTAVSRTSTRVVDAVKPPTNDSEQEARISRREAIERTVGVSVTGLTTVALGWGMTRGRHAFELEEVVVKVPGWPRALDGYVIAQVSDIHVGTFVGERELDEGFELVRRVKPDLVVATGDLVDSVANAVGPLLRKLVDVGARDGAYAILGNHDHYATPEWVADLIARSNVKLLHNENVRVRPGDGGGFALLGVDDLEGRRRLRTPLYYGPDLGRALRNLPPDLPRILLSHQPQFFTESQGRVALQLSGHTHGGQINPGFRPVRAFTEFVAGRYERAGSTLWVNRGFGVVGPPVRLGAPPEVTKIVIVAA